MIGTQKIILPSMILPKTIQGADTLFPNSK